MIRDKRCAYGLSFEVNQKCFATGHESYTPLEVLEGRDNWLDVKKVIADAKKERVEANKVARCENCSCSVEERCSEGVGENGNGQK